MHPNLDTTTKQSDAWGGIRLLRVLVTVAIVGATIFLVGSLVTTVTSDSLASPLHLDLPLDAISSPYPTAATIEAATATVDVTAGFGVRLLWWAVTDALALVAIGFLELFRRILSDGDDPFTEQNATRLRWMSILALAVACVSLARPIVAFMVQDRAGFDGLEATWDFGSLWLWLVLVALLEMWRHGVALRTERDLTI